MRTLALGSGWDLTVTSGNLSVIDGSAAIAQDVASAVRLFRGELWYDTTRGVPYFEAILGQAPPAGVVTARVTAAALTVPHVVRVRDALDPVGVDRRLTGTLTITDDRGQTVVTPLPWYIKAQRDFP
jgi:hypothetical protein